MTPIVPSDSFSIPYIFSTELSPF